MKDGNFLIVKLAAAGDVLRTTAMARELRRARPHAAIGWLTSAYAAPLLAGNPDLDEVLAVPAPTAGSGRARAALVALAALHAWRRRYGAAAVLVAHRSTALRALARAGGHRRVFAFHDGAACAQMVRFRLDRHRLQLDADLLRAAGIELPQAWPLQPRLALCRWELAAGEAVWAAATRAPRWALAPGGGANPWASMPNRRWPRERFLDLARRALAQGITLRWLGGAADAPLAEWIHQHLPGMPAAPGQSRSCAGRLSLRESAAVIASADLVIGNDSVALVMAQALGKPALGLYGPTSGVHIHAPEQPFLQGQAGCGPCYDPRAGANGLAYVCPHAACMDQIGVDEVWRRACALVAGERAHAVC